MEMCFLRSRRAHLFVRSLWYFNASVPIGRTEIKTPTGSENTIADGRIHWTTMCLVKKKHLPHSQQQKITCWKMPPTARRTAVVGMPHNRARRTCRRARPLTKLPLRQRAWQRSRARLFCLPATRWMLKLGQLRFQLLSREVTRKPIPLG